MAIPDLRPGWTRAYQRTWLRPDLIAGLTVLAYLVPQTLAYSGLVGLPPIAGLATALAALTVYALIGTSRISSVGPESTVALMAGLIIAPLVQANPEHATGIVAAITLLTGAWLAAAWLARAGAISDLLTKPILTGYLTGGAILMISSQLGKATRSDSSGDTVAEQLSTFTQNLDRIHWPTIAVTGITLAILFTLPRVSRKIPAALAAIAAATIASYLLDADTWGLAQLGPLPTGLPSLSLPTLTYDTLGPLLLGSLSIALVAFTDVMLTARAFAGRGEQVNANRELLATAGVHAASALTGGYPASASSSRTAIAQASGAKSQAASLWTAAGIAAVMLAAGPLFEHLPAASLAAVVIWAATRLIALGDYRRLWRFRRGEFAVAAATALGTATLGILPGIGVAVALSAAQLLAALARPHEAIQGYAPGKAGLHDIDDHDGAVTIPGLLIYRYDAPLLAVNAGDFRARLSQAVDTHQPDWCILNVEANMLVDYTAGEMLHSTIITLQANGITVGLARLKQDLHTQLQAAGVIDLVAPHTYETLPQAIKAYQDAHPHIETPPMPGPGEAFQPLADSPGEAAPPTGSQPNRPAGS